MREGVPSNACMSFFLGCKAIYFKKHTGVSLSFCAGGQWGFPARHFLVFLMKESKKRRRKQPGKLMAKYCSQPVNLPGARPLMNPLSTYKKYNIQQCIKCYRRQPN